MIFILMMSFALLEILELSNCTVVCSDGNFVGRVNVGQSNGSQVLAFVFTACVVAGVNGVL